MSATAIAVLGVQAVVFAVWAFHAFRVLFHLRARVVEESDRAFPGMAVTLRMFRAFAQEPRYARDRRLLLGLTLLLFALIGVFALLAPVRVPG